MKDLKHLLKINIIVYIYLPNSSRQTETILQYFGFALYNMVELIK